MSKEINYDRFWSHAFENMEDFIFLIDKDFHVARVNKSFLDFTNGRAEDFIGKMCYEVIHDTDAPFGQCPHARMIESGKFEESEFFEPRLKKWLYVRVTPIFDDNGRIAGSIHMATDVTRLKEIGLAVEKTFKETQSLLDLVPAWIFYKDKENRFIRVNQQFADIMGVPKKELEGKSLYDMYSKEQADAFWQDDLEVIRSGKPKTNIVERAPTKKGILWVKTDKVPYRDASGQIIGVIGFTIDITELKKAEDRMSRSEAYLNKIINSMADPLFVKDEGHRWILVNDSFCSFMGRRREEVLGKSDYDFFSKEEADVFWKIDNEVLESGETKVNEEKFTGSNKEVRTISTKKTLYSEPGGRRLIVGIIRDMTGEAEIKKELEKRLSSLERFQKITVDRELKMKELKARIKELEAEYAQPKGSVKEEKDGR